MMVLLQFQVSYWGLEIKIRLANSTAILRWRPRTSQHDLVSEKVVAIFVPGDAGWSLQLFCLLHVGQGRLQLQLR